METDFGNEHSNNDEVVFESVVRLTKTLSESLYLFNYPIKHDGNITEDSTCLSARIKPKQQRVELEFGIDINAGNYDASRGEQIAYNVDCQSANGECYFNSGIMDKKLLVGTKVPDSNLNYALCCMRKGEFLMTPLPSILELNPGYIHMDKIDTSTKKTLNANENEGGEEEAVAVTMRFEGPNAERDRQIRQKSYQYFQQRNASEPWVNLNYHKLGSARSAAECEKLLCSQVYHQDSMSTVVAKQDYLKELVPECLRLSGCQTSTDEDAAVLIDKPLSDQIRHLMINAHLLTFSTLAEKLPHNVDTLSIERLLQQIGVLVQGCWAVKSELLYPENTVSPQTGVGAKQLINARDYILWLFTRTRFVTRKEILSAIRVLDEDFKAMMIPLANKTNRGWEFKFPTDNEFLENHPSIQQSQDIKWKLRYNKFVKDLKMSETEGWLFGGLMTQDPNLAKLRQHGIRICELCYGEKYGFLWMELAQNLIPLGPENDEDFPLARGKRYIWKYWTLYNQDHEDRDECPLSFMTILVIVVLLLFLAFLFMIKIFRLSRCYADSDSDSLTSAERISIVNPPPHRRTYQATQVHMQHPGRARFLDSSREPAFRDSFRVQDAVHATGETLVNSRNASSTEGRKATHNAVADKPPDYFTVALNDFGNPSKTTFPADYETPPPEYKPIL